MDTLEQDGELCRITAEVDWNLELADILRRSLAQRGPAILFENIRGYRQSWCTKLFANALGTRGRIAMMLGLPRDASHERIVSLTRQRLREPVAPVLVESGPVKEHVISGYAVDLYQLPVPLWHEFDGGRYIDTWCAVVTRDPSCCAPCWHLPGHDRRAQQDIGPAGGHPRLGPALCQIPPARQPAAPVAVGAVPNGTPRWSTPPATRSHMTSTPSWVRLLRIRVELVVARYQRSAGAGKRRSIGARRLRVDRPCELPDGRSVRRVQRLLRR